MAWNQTPGTYDFRHDGGYINMLNNYGTSQDNSTAYQFTGDGIIPDMLLTNQYESNGLFSKIIDAPAEEAIKHGFELGLKSPDILTYITEKLDGLKWDSSAVAAIKWSRLYGGALGVMFIDDGGGLDESLDWQHIKDIDEIRIYERAVVEPDYTSLYNYGYNYNQKNRAQNTASRFGMPEYYFVQSLYGQFRVHESRCLVFRNGILPERTTNSRYRFWGMPEYVRIKRELREAITSHSYGVKMLERSVQAIYKMKDLASLLAAEDGESVVIKRLQVIDMARGLLNSIAIDSEAEDYDFKVFSMTGVKDIIDTTCNMLSAVSFIPQTILFGRSPAGENATGESDFENWYNYVERQQKLMLKDNLTKLIDIIIRAGLYQRRIEEEPAIKLMFNPMWSMSESEQAAIKQQKAATQQQKAQTAQIYVDMGALDPTEVRRGLAKEEEFEIEELLDDIDIESEDLWGGEELPNDPMTAEQADEKDNKIIFEKVQKPLTKSGIYDKIIDTKNTDEDEEWITVNGAAIPVENGELKGEVGEKIVEETAETEKYDKIFKEAKEGKGTRTSTYKALSALSDSSISKSAESFRHNISIHQDKIANPAKHVTDWEKRDERYKKGLIKYWEKEIKNQRDQLEIATRIKGEKE